MRNRKLSVSGLLLASAALCGLSGCNTVGPDFGVLAIPIPVSPYHQHRAEEKFYDYERYERVPILGPTTSGGPPIALDPPTPDEVWRALERARPTEGGVPLLWEKQRNNVRMVIEPMGDYCDPPRIYPLIGPAILHHAHYKCTIYFTDVTRVGWPLPHTLVDEDAREVLYIDHDHFHRVGDESAPPANLH